MNIIRNIESLTLLSIGALCASAVLSLAGQSAHAVTTSQATVTQLPAVVIVGKRLSAEEKAAMRAEASRSSRDHITL